MPHTSRIVVMAMNRLGLEVSEDVVDWAITLAFQALGYKKTSEDHRKVVKGFVGGKDVFVVLPTGSGKSLCFVSLSLVFENICLHSNSDKLVSPVVIVLSPLISLMKDQVKKYNGKGVKCASIGEELDQHEERHIERAECHVLYCSPESFLTIAKWRDMLASDVYRDNLVRLIVDEAHCVHSW